MRVGQQDVRLRQRLDPPLDAARIGGGVVGAGQADDALDERERVLGAMVDLAQQDMLARGEVAGAAFLGDVELRREIIEQPAVVVGDRAEQQPVPELVAVAAVVEQFDASVSRPAAIARADRVDRGGIGRPAPGGSGSCGR